MNQAVLDSLQKAQSLIDKQKFSKAEILCKKILKREPVQPDALHLLGLIALQKNNYTKAIHLYKKAISIKDNQPYYHYNIGLAYLKSLELDNAVTHLQLTISLYPEMNAAYSDLCLALTKQGNIEAAVMTGKKAVELTPDNSAAHNNLAFAYHEWKDFDSSYEHYVKAAELAPELVSLQFELGHIHIGRGDIEAAKQCFRKIMQLKPNDLLAYTSIVKITKYKGNPNHSDAIQLKSFIKNKTLSADARISVLFALAKIYQDCELYDEAFAYFKEANKLQDDIFAFNPSNTIKATSLLIKHCSKEIINEKRNMGNTSHAPIFIVGTPRSGTTLTEQIISSHPDVFGAGELNWVPQATNNLSSFLDTPLEYPQCLTELDANNIDELANKYLTYIHSLANGESKIVDKLPGNFLHIGFILCLFPNAKIIHCRREPRDACVSMFCNLFSTITYSYDLYKLGVFYSQYQLTMQHWLKTFPENTILEVDYENLVANQEVESRRLIDYIGLEWHNDCLKFYNQKRSVHTASDLQVIKPMYSSSVARWKNYEKHLQPLEKGLKAGQYYK